MKSIAVVVDYQNVHLTAAGIFLRGRPVEEALIEPFKFACQLVKARNAHTSEEHQVELKRVEVFRGLPIPEDDPDANRRNQEQKEHWLRGHHGVVDITLRPLKYEWEYIDGERRPNARSRREKGVDVLCALSLMRLARSKQYDVVALASRDTDLAPALDEAARLGVTKIEAAKWFDPALGYTRGNIRTDERIWTTSMLREHFQGSLDLRNYA